MGHYCWVCSNVLPNEKFSGKGHSRHICKKCSKLPKEILEKLSNEKFIYNVLAQKNITLKNIKMLQIISKKYNGKLYEQASIIIKVAKVHPNKKKRIGFLYNKYRKLFDELVRLGFIEDFITPCIQDEIEYERLLDLQEIEYKKMQKNYKIEFFQDKEYNDELPF